MVLGPASHEPSREKTLSDIRLGDWWRYALSLRALCTNCGAERPVPMSGLFKAYGEEMRITEADLPRIAKRSRCLSCGEVGKVTLVIVEG